jgi:hypothetical protein
MTSFIGPPLLKRIYKTLLVARLHFFFTYVLSILNILKDDKSHERKIFQLIICLLNEITSTL